jgi:hypothetical protein
MNSAFVVFHARVKDLDNEDIKLIGIFSSKQTAEAAVTKAKDLSGFCDHQNGFSISEYTIDEIHWSEGFGV